MAVPPSAVQVSPKYGGKPPSVVQYGGSVSAVSGLWFSGGKIDLNSNLGSNYGAY